MRNYNHSIAGVVAGIATGLAAWAYSGCCAEPEYNAPPTVSVSERDGTPVKQLTGVEVEDDADQHIFLPISRDSIKDGDATYVVTFRDEDGPEALESNFYAAGDTNLRAKINRGTNKSDRQSWDTTLAWTGDDNISTGTYLIARGSSTDGANTIRLNVYGVIIGEGDESPKFVPGDGVCEKDKGENHENSPEDCPAPETSGIPQAFFILDNGRKLGGLETLTDSTIVTRLVVPPEKANYWVPMSVHPKELGPGSCVDMKVGSFSPVAGHPGTYDAPVTLDLTCADDGNQVIEADWKVSHAAQPVTVSSKVSLK